MPCSGRSAKATPTYARHGFDRNDVLGNLAVLLAAAGVFGTGTDWPDGVVAAIMAGLALQAASTVIQKSLGELRQPASVPAE